MRFKKNIVLKNDWYKINGHGTQVYSIHKPRIEEGEEEGRRGGGREGGEEGRRMLGQKEVYIATLLCFIITVTGQVNNLLLYRFCAERRGTDSDTGVRLLALWPQATGYIDITRGM